MRRVRVFAGLFCLVAGVVLAVALVDVLAAVPFGQGKTARSEKPIRFILKMFNMSCLNHSISQNSNENAFIFARGCVGKFEARDETRRLTEEKEPYMRILAVSGLRKSRKSQNRFFQGRRHTMT